MVLRAKEYFVDEDSIVRQIWGRSDTILFIFAGASAEFALNKAVDWLYFTGRLPADPLVRLFSTVTYARSIVFSDHQTVMRTIDNMAAIHDHVESSRGARIPDWAYRDVLFMLIDYSIRAFEILERKLTIEEKEEVLHVFIRMGSRMGLKGLPESGFAEFKNLRQHHLLNDLQVSTYTTDLFLQYRRHLGLLRYFLLREVQAMIVPAHVHVLLKFNNFKIAKPLLLLYKISRKIKMDWLLRELILPLKYKTQINALDTF